MCNSPGSVAEKLRLYLVADPPQTRHDLVPAVAEALANGVSAVQLRAKEISDRELFGLAELLKNRCHGYGALFIVNDRVDIALAVGADGVHLGVGDLPLIHARRLLGPTAVIGYSPETDAETSQARAVGATYLGVGPVYGTTSKDDAGNPIGLDGLERRVNLAGIPVIGIGGITAANAPPVLAAGAVGVAVIGAILRAPDVGAATRQLARALAARTA